jgi:single-strand DNA-binding protein
MMINEAQLSLTGYVATQPRFRHTNSGAPVASMRVAWTPRRLDRETGEWSDGQTSYVTVLCWRKLADNVALCIRKGDPVVVKGRLSIRPYEKDGVPRLAVEVDAGSVGHDLSRGAAHFQRTKRAPGETAADQMAAGFAAGGLPGGGLPGDESLRRGESSSPARLGGTAGDPATASAGDEGDGPAGSGSADPGSADPGSADPGSVGSGGPGSGGSGTAGSGGAGDVAARTDDDIFDDAAIAALAQAPDPVSAPF